MTFKPRGLGRCPFTGTFPGYTCTTFSNAEGAMSNHPNRSQTNRNVGSNPKLSEILRAREAAGLTQTEAGMLVHSALKSWQNWESDGQNNRRMHPAIWELFTVKCNARRLLKDGKITPASLRELGLYLPPVG